MRRTLRTLAALAIRGARRLDHRSLRTARFDVLGQSQRYAMVATGHEDFVVLTADQVISRHVFVNGGFEFGTFEKVMSILGGGQLQTLIDVGANIGTICIPALKRGLAATAVAIEPEPRNYRTLVANVYINELEKQVALHNLAMGAQDNQTLEFEISPDNGGDHRVRVSRVDGTYAETKRALISVQSRRLDDIAPPFDPAKSLLWIDVQGFEGHVLSGATKTLRTGIPVVVEFWPYGMKRADCYPALRTAVQAYRSFYDLSEARPKPVALTAESLDRLYAALGEDGRHTDLLLTNTLSAQ